MTELKPCPFCGGKAYVSREDCYGELDDYYMVHCDTCSLQFGFTKQFECEKQVTDAWNMRVEPNG